MFATDPDGNARAGWGLQSLALEEKCVKCDGVGSGYKDREGYMMPQWFQCEHCGGAGRMLTESGRALLEFVHRHTMILGMANLYIRNEYHDPNVKSWGPKLNVPNTQQVEIE